MPTYPVIHLKSGEKKELSMSMKAYDEWRNYRYLVKTYTSLPFQ